MKASDVERLQQLLEKNKQPGAVAGRRSPDAKNESNCPKCNARITETKQLGEVGHKLDCPRRPDRYNGGSES